MENTNALTKKGTIIKYIALIIGIACLLLTFVTPTRVVMIGSIYGDYIVFALTAIGVLLSIYSIRISEKKLIPILSLILSLSFPIMFVLWLILLFTGTIDFAP
ncbi:hypothetical protein [Shouchella lehensis]|uniref:Uncharacterized protein n=1 Tax=Shouchella lehensis TaxID=300825 RepID=A0A4Y7WI04_9BACI|nr:hypothetical protein [Shouchella lehensis]MBG9785600.1 hypothetical protein [Shouchella lehensis]RQW19863.1 hypothetical protein EH196_06875 [Bacillus sp. C1-1]TES48050.1 hypothetical protein E2L03_13020 [Shouchella lehensis]